MNIDKPIAAINYLVTPPADVEEFTAVRKDYQELIELSDKEDWTVSSKVTVFFQCMLTFSRLFLMVPIILIKESFTFIISVPVVKPAAPINLGAFNGNISLTDKFFSSVKNACIYLRMATVFAVVTCIGVASNDTLKKCLYIPDPVSEEGGSVEAPAQSEVSRLENEISQLRDRLGRVEAHIGRELLSTSR